MSEQLIKTPGVFGDNGNFLLERELGAGGMGGVYMGRDKMLDRPVAVKVMLPEYGSDPEFVDKFKKEAQSAARLLHPNIAQVYSYGISDGMPYIAMELASGGSLYSLMKANPGKLDIQRALKICQQTAQALQCATDQGVVHGDVKPENILLDANGNAKLVDFGLAAMQKDTNEIWGTPFYISPEKVKKEIVDFRADMYSLGGTLYHALTGVPPFDGDDAIAVVKKRFEVMPKKPSEIRSDITPAVDELVLRMLALEKDERYPSFEALLEAFKEVLASGLANKTTKIEGTTPKTGAATLPGGKKVVTSRMRRPMMKKTGAASPSTTSKVTPETAADEDASKSAETESDEEEGGSKLIKKVIISVVGGIVAIAAIAGGLVWYLNAVEADRVEQERAMHARTCAQGHEAIDGIRKAAEKFAADFDGLAEKAIASCEKYSEEITKHMPEYADMLKSGSAATEKPAAEGGEAQQIPGVIRDMQDLWDRANACRDGQAHVAQALTNIVSKCNEAEVVNGQTKEDAQVLSDISSAAKDLYDQMSTLKDVEVVKKANSFIKTKGDQLVKKTIRDIKIQKGEAERAQKKADAEKAATEKAAAEAEARKALVEKETSEIAAKFDNLGNCFKQLDWASATRQLMTTASEFQTAEGELAAKFQLHKVEQMKSVQDIIISKGSGFVFKAGKALKGGKISKINDKELQVLTKGKTTKIGWRKFYTEYPGNFNELLNAFILKGKGSGLNLSVWEDAMVGAALTMRLVCSELPGATEKAVQLAKEVVKKNPDSEKRVKEVFPDIDFTGVAEQE